MKKRFNIALIILLLSLGPVRAETDPDNLNTTIPVRLSSPFTQTFQRVTGITWLASSIGGYVGKREIRKQLKSGSHLTLKIKSYSASDLGRGNVKAISLSGQDVQFKNTPPLESLSVTTDPKTPIHLSDTRHPVLLRPVNFTFQAKIAEADINTFFKSSDADGMLKNIKVELPPFSEQRVDILSPVVDLTSARMKTNASVILHDAAPETALPVEVSGKLTPAKNRLNLSNIVLNIEGLEQVDQAALADFIEEYFGEIVNLEQLKIKDHKLTANIQRCDTTDDALTFQAVITVKATDKALAKYQQK